MKVALDTNILAYAEGVNGADRKLAALALVSQLPAASVVLPVQTLGELYQVLVRKAGRSPTEARAAILSWRNSFALADTTPETLLTAADLAVHHRFSLWDAVILSAAAQAQCRILLSEDMQNGFLWQGVTIVNPFTPTQHPLLKAALETGQ
uniref:PIN domain-containing protein n=1 Tax=mine drainage metagenome TaxID=410659 RepID=E6PYL9_9ZZZZ